jgi:hypothetical protein
VVLVAVLVASTLALVQSRGDKDDHASGAAGEIFLEAASEPGAEPFTDSVAGEVFLPSAPVPFPSTTAPPTGQTAVLTTTGTQPGLFGGTRDNARCDVAQMIAFLEADPVKATAWAAVAGIQPSEIRSYLEGLTPMQLRVDTRVTNHGFRNGRATPRQAVLQAGTAVLVDAAGVPRAKCGCGNPLAPPQAVATTPTYVGPQWTGFSPVTVIVVQPGPPVVQWVLVDARTGAPFVRPVGTRGTADVDAPPGTDVSNPLGNAQASTPSSIAPSGSAATIRGTVSLLPEVTAQLPFGSGNVQTVASEFAASISAGGAVTGQYSISIRTIEDNGCTYVATVSGALTGTLTGGSFAGTWAGSIEETVESGDCSEVLLLDQAAKGTWDGSFDAGTGRATGSISLETSRLFGYEARR